MFRRPKKKIESISEINNYISKFQRTSKNGQAGALRIVKNGDCWEWIGAKSATQAEIEKRRKVPYGRLGLDANLSEYFAIYDRRGKHIRPHVLMYHCYEESLNDLWHDIEKGRIQVAHKCGNSMCCRPDHLYLASREENSRDRILHRKELDQLMMKERKELNWWRRKGAELGIEYPEFDSKKNMRVEVSDAPFQKRMKKMKLSDRLLVLKWVLGHEH